MYVSIHVFLALTEVKLYWANPNYTKGMNSFITEIFILLYHLNFLCLCGAKQDNGIQIIALIFKVKANPSNFFDKNYLLWK